MNTLSKLAAVALCAGGLATNGFADGRNPGSVLIFPLQRAGMNQDPDNEVAAYFTVLSVTNAKLGGSIGDVSTNIQYEYVNTVYNPDLPLKPLHCSVADRVEVLTPADTLSVLTQCHNAGMNEGYAVVTAQDPSKFKTAWSHNYLMGSQMVITSSGASYSLNALPFESPLDEGLETDLDLDGELDFDGAEYEGVPDRLYLDNFASVLRPSLILINLTGGTEFVAACKIDAFNDNEFPLSQTVQFRCWFEEELTDVSHIFEEDFLRYNTPHDPDELDINCDSDGEVETGWFMLRGINASSTVETILDPAIVGAVTSMCCFESGGRLLWESAEKQFNGDFLKFGTDDPEN